MKNPAHATNPQIALLLGLFGERDWSEQGDPELIPRIEQLHEACLGVYTGRQFHRPQGIVLNEILTENGYEGLPLSEAGQLINYLKSLPRVECY